MKSRFLFYAVGAFFWANGLSAADDLRRAALGNSAAKVAEQRQQDERDFRDLANAVAEARKKGYYVVQPDLVGRCSESDNLDVQKVHAQWAAVCRELRPQNWAEKLWEEHEAHMIAERAERERIARQQAAAKKRDELLQDMLRGARGDRECGYAEDADASEEE